LLDVGEASITEAFSLPLQQLARVICDGKELTNEEAELLSKIFDIEEIPEIYQSWWADPIKFEIRSNDVDFFEANLGEYIRLWLNLGLKHPDSYAKAWIDQTRGYWNGGYFYHMYNQMVQENAYGIVRAESRNLVSIVADYYYALTRHLIFFEPVHSIGLHVWYVALCWFLNVLKKREEWILSVLPLVIIAGLQLGTPVFAEFRYAYPVFTTYSFIIGVSLFAPQRVLVDDESASSVFTA